VSLKSTTPRLCQRNTSDAAICLHFRHATTTYWNNFIRHELANVSVLYNLQCSVLQYVADVSHTGIEGEAGFGGDEQL